jgi:hypothetical protein
VDTVAGKLTWDSRARSRSFDSRYRARLAPGVDDRIQTVQPLFRLDRIDVRELVDEAVEDHALILSRGRLIWCAMWP